MREPTLPERGEEIWNACRRHGFSVFEALADLLDELLMDELPQLYRQIVGGRRDGILEIIRPQRGPGLPGLTESVEWGLPPAPFRTDSLTPFKRCHSIDDTVIIEHHSVVAFGTGAMHNAVGHVSGNVGLGPL